MSFTATLDLCRILYGNDRAVAHIGFMDFNHVCYASCSLLSGYWLAVWFARSTGLIRRSEV